MSLNHTIFYFLLIILVGYVILNLFLYIGQSRFIYFPQKKIYITPTFIGLKYEPVTFYSEDGIKLSAWFIPAEPARGVVLFCHGNAGNISHRLDSIQIFNRLGLSVLIFDYRGYGESEGITSEEGTYLDAMAAWNYLMKGHGGQDVYIFGRSIGGVIATWLASMVSPKGLIVESAFTSVPDIASELYPFLPVRLLCRFKYNALEYIKQVKAPVLIVHSPQDEIISFSYGERLFDAANEPKYFLKISGDHNSGFLSSGRLYIQGLKDFIERASDMPSQGNGI